MRIAYFTETFLPKIDGVVNTLCHLLDHLQVRGHQSVLFAPAGSPAHYAATPVVGLQGYAFPLYPEIKLVPPWVRIRDRLDEFNPDVVHLLNPFALGLAGLRQSQALGIPVVASYHTDLPGYVTRYGFRFLSNPAWTYLRWLHNHAALNLCPSRTTLGDLEAHGFERLKVWTRGVDTDKFHPRHFSDDVRNWLSGKEPAAPLLLYVGRLAPEKRVDRLLPVIQSLPQARLAIVGDGPARQQLQEQFAGTGTVFTGYLRGRDLAQAFAAADVFVFPSANETFGNVVLEAMASGLPAVAAAAGGPLDFVIQGENGYLFPPDDEATFVAAVRRLVDDRGYLRQLGQQARAYAETRSWSSVLDLLLDDYSSVVGSVDAKPEPERLTLS